MCNLLSCSKVGEGLVGGFSRSSANTLNEVMITTETEKFFLKLYWNSSLDFQNV